MAFMVAEPYDLRSAFVVILLADIPVYYLVLQRQATTFMTCNKLNHHCIVP